jgi:hypothetical protein
VKVLYISGPFSHPDPVHGISRNILQAYRYVAEEIRPMPATMLPVYDMLTEEASPHAAD